MAVLVLSGSGALAAEPQIAAADATTIRAIVEPFERPAGTFDDVDWENAFGGRRKGAADLTRAFAAPVESNVIGGGIPRIGGT